GAWGIDEEFSTVSVSYRWDGIPHAELIYTPRNVSFLGSDLFTNGNRVDIWMGYPRIRDLESVYMGAFVIEHSELVQRDGRSPSLRLSCYGAGIILTREDKRRAFRSRRDSDIATDIAAENGLSVEDSDGIPTIHKTPYVLDQVTQAGETDLEFLRRRADLYGYQCFTYRQRLYFKSPKMQKPAVVFGSVGAVPIISFTGGPDSIGSGMRHTYTDFDPITGELVSLTSDGFENEALVQTKDGIKSQLIRGPRDIVGGSFDRFVLGAGHQVDTKRVRTHVRSLAKKSAYLSSGSVILGTMPHVKPMDTVELFASGRFGGPYFVTSVTHEVSSEMGKHSIMNLTRSFEGVATPLEKLVMSSSAQGRGESTDAVIVVEDTQNQG
ncbi:MAG: hypothetical protein ABIH23_31485, partial [bacterium]